ncbi:hypothetical protein GCM10011344_32730 [Dokdonia pacifica]|uniref:Uncharacterized protein n=1 Tax=Dokdonia pacifica TaxID=1627892 RepID=A0A239BIM3_9FLAO|nr:hypothetical protein [Dokdonia pacifica]GGG29328.1 hypothetical protein GCM10011344_32730 [Dokdonia pacifica]SNS07529.1 hypothetical protein SAMN06265376_106191 [Dokdonia pacifica]
MPKPATYPPILDSLHRISIALERDQGHFKEGKKITTLLKWECRGVVNAEAYFTSDMINDVCSIVYIFNDEIVKTKIYLERIKSNLGKGDTIYFVCPFTGLRCRVLYRYGKHFKHRTAYPKAMYRSQTESKRDREFRQSFGWHYQNQKIADELNSKHLKKTYKGKVTKRFARLYNRLTQVNSITMEDFKDWSKLNY